MDVFNYSPRNTEIPTTTAFSFGWLTVYFSYKKVIAVTVRLGGRVLFCRRKHAGSVTSSKHANYVARDANFGGERFSLDDDRFDAVLRVLEARMGARNDDALCDELAAMMGCDVSAGRV